jgi:putative flippase GtrA
MTSDVASLTQGVPLMTATRRPWQQLVRFAVVGVVSTAAYAMLYLLLRSVLGAFAANGLALLITAVANTAANRRLTFGVRGSAGVFGDHAVGLLAFAAGLLLTSGALAALHAVSRPSQWLELVVLMVANALATLLRFVALRLRIARPK